MHGVAGKPEEVRLTAARTRCAVVGHPVGHSLSPLVHTTAYELLGLPQFSYGLHDLLPGEFEAWVAGRDDTWRGLSVTMPHKEVTATLGEPDADVTLTGVANTLLWRADGHTSVHNTDIPGVGAALRHHGLASVGRAVVIGSGATARSTMVALHRFGVPRVDVCGRTPERVDDLVAFATDLGLEAAPTPWGEPWAPEVDLVVSSVPGEATGPVEAALRAAGPQGLRAVFDLSYWPWPTPLAKAAAASGVEIIGGLDLLVHQAVVQITLMTGHTPPVNPLLSAARAEQARRAGA